MNEERISVIVPLYYGEKYVQTIVNKMETNVCKARRRYQLELIFVNDSPEIKIELPKNDFLNIFLYENSCNKGIHYSRVKGLRHASGNYVLFLDQDDEIADDYFDSQLSTMHKCDVSVSNGIAEYAGYKKVLYKYIFMQWTVKYIWFYAKFDCRIISPGQCLIRRSSIPEIWTKNIMTKNGADDYFLWLLMLSQEKKFGINRELLYTHKYTAENVSEDKEKIRQSVAEMLTFLENEMCSKYINLIRMRIAGTGVGAIGKLLVRVVENINKK